MGIQSTDTDAAVSRLSAVSLGYLIDPYASIFVQGPSTRRLPIINRGTYARTVALDILINSFITTSENLCGGQTRQIISLGAGTDTRYFRLRDENKHINLVYHEFDFLTVSEAKRKTITGHAEIFKKHESEYLWSAAQSTSEISNSMEWGFTRQQGSPRDIIYCFHPVDLRKITVHESPESFAGVRTDVPTLILSECCLCYMDVNKSNDVVRWFTNNIPSVCIALYEPIEPDDAFGQMMISNLAARNIFMPSLKHYKSLADQCLRLSDFGFNNSDSRNGFGAENIENIWERWISDTEKLRVDGLEGLDEFEEWEMLARHYAVVWGWRSVDSGWERLSRLQNEK